MILDEIAKAIEGQVVGNTGLEIRGVNSADNAEEGEITFAENPQYLAAAERSRASAIIVGENAAVASKSVIRVSNVRIAVARLLPLFSGPKTEAAGIHATAVIHETAEIDSSAHIGPHCVISAGVKIGADSVLTGGNHVGVDCVIGAAVKLYANVVLYGRTVIGNRVTIHAGTVVGSDGYGYVFDRGSHVKVLQTGNVIVEDDVEIGASAAIDRAAFGSTRIGAGTKIDNLVHVAHNVAMGKHCLILGQAGFAGSTHLGDYCVVAAQAGVAGHLNLGRQSTVGAKSGVMRDVADGETVLGIPAMPHKQTKRQWVAQQQLPEMLRRLRDLELAVNKLTSRTEGRDS